MALSYVFLTAHFPRKCIWRDNINVCQFQEEEKDEETTGIDKTLEIDEETADSAPDKDEEEATDSDLDKREDAVAGKTNVTVYGEIKKGYCAWKHYWFTCIFHNQSQIHDLVSAHAD